jgi:hypothetical protein
MSFREGLQPAPESHTEVRPTPETATYTAEQVKDIIKVKIGSHAEITQLELVPTPEGLQLKCKLDAGMLGGRIELDCRLISNNGEISVQNLDVKARGYVKSKIEDSISKVPSEIKKYFETKSGKKIESIKIAGSNLVVEFAPATPPVPAMAETAKAKAPEAGSTGKIEAKLKPEKATGEIASAHGEGTPGIKPESVEARKEAPALGAAVVEVVKTDPQTPPEVKKVLENPANAHAAAEAVENKTTFGSKTKNFLKNFGAGFVAGAAARAGVRFFAMRILDFGTVGSGALAGGAVGGGMELYKSYRAETKRLYDMKTYTDALTGYDAMGTDLERVKALVAVEAALKENIKSKKLSPTQRAEYEAKLQYLRTKIETSKQEGWEQKEGADKIKLLLQYRSQADGEQLKQEESKEVTKLLKDFQKERGLKKNGKKIAWETTKGVVFGAAGGALGAWVFDNATHYASSHGWTPKSWGTHVGAGNSSETGHPGSPGAVPGADGAETIMHVPSAEDAQTLHKTVWDSCKQYMIDHGVGHPSTQDINEAMIRICHENGIEISGHHNVADFSGFQHEHFKDLIDIKLQNGLQLHGFDKLADIVQHAGGHALGPQEIVLHSPAGTVARDWLNTHGVEAVKEEEKHLLHMTWLIYGAEAAAGTGTALGVGLWLKKKFKKEPKAEDGQSGADSSDMKIFGDLNPEEPLSKTPELMSGNLEQANLEQRLSVLGQIKAEALQRIVRGGQYLQGDNPNVGLYKHEWNNLDILLGQEQFEYIAKGASAQDKDSVGNAWDGMIGELNAAAKPFEEKAEQLEKLAASRASAEQPDDANLDNLDPGDEDAPGLKPKKAESKKAGGHELRKEPKKKQPKTEVSPKAPPKPEDKTKGEKETEAEKLGLEPWQLKLYNRMVFLKLMSPLPEGKKFEEGSGNLHRLNKFSLFTKEDGGLFKSLTAGGAKRWQSVFFDAIADLKENKSTSLKDFCLKILTKGEQLGKSNQARHILQEMDDIATEVKMVVDQALAEFKPAKKK